VTPVWSYPWENDLGPDDHARLSILLQMAFPWTSGLFTEDRSWGATRPERRVIGSIGGEMVAHAAVLRRFVRVGDADQLVGEVGLVAVHPDRRRRGLGGQLVRRVNRALADLGVPFGLLTCAPRYAPLATGAGWRPLTGVALRQPTTASPYRAVAATDAAVLVLPVRAGIDGWPPGPVLDRNGFET